MEKIKWIFPVLGLILLYGGFFVERPDGNFPWHVYDVVLGIWCIALPFTLSLKR